MFMVDFQSCNKLRYRVTIVPYSAPVATSHGSSTAPTWTLASQRSLDSDHCRNISSTTPTKDLKIDKQNLTKLWFYLFWGVTILIISLHRHLYTNRPLSVVCWSFGMPEMWHATCLPNPGDEILVIVETLSLRQMPPGEKNIIYIYTYIDRFILSMCLYIYLFAFILKLRMLSSITIYLSTYLSIYLSIYLSSYMHITPSLIKSNIKPPIGTRATKAPHGRTHSSHQGQMLQQLQRPGEKNCGLQPQKWWCSLHYYDISPSKHIKTYQNTYQNWDLTSTFGI